MEDFIPDILLTGPGGDQLFLEIAVNHKSSQDKIASGYPIIEIAIASEEDIVKYCSLPLVEGDNVHFFNMRPLLTGDLCAGSCSRVEPGAASTLFYRCFYVTRDGRSVHRAHLGFDGVELIRNDPETIYTDVEVATGAEDLALLKSTEKAFFALSKQGISFKSCILCRDRLLWTDSACMPENQRDAQIYCQRLAEAVTPDQAAVCPHFQGDRDLLPVTGNANFKPFRKSLAKLQPTLYQSNILNWLETAEGNLLCNAFAGSGKSSTLMMIAQKLLTMGYRRERIRIAVFGKKNQEDLVSKFGKEWNNSISTFHSIGRKFLRDMLFVKRLKLKKDKYWQIIRKLGIFADNHPRIESFVKLLEVFRLDLGTGRSLEDLADFHDLDVHFIADLEEKVGQVLWLGEKDALESASVDFTDMVYLPVLWSMQGSHSFPDSSLDWVLVDECQDLSPTIFEFFMRLADSSVRLIFVGDRHQAIMGFAGAHTEMLDTIKVRTTATELPLPICYRCPSSHLNLVNKVFPDIGIESDPNSLLGEIFVIAQDMLYNSSKSCCLRDGDLVISRKRASLISLWFYLFSHDVKTIVKGIDPTPIVSIIRDISKVEGFTYDKFGEYAVIYRAKQLEKGRLQGSKTLEYKQQNLDDKLAFIELLYSRSTDCCSVSDLCSRVEAILRDDGSSAPVLSTCHSAKGLERDRVFIYSPEDLPLTWTNQQGWMSTQEWNLLYVSLTRSRHSLYFICEEHPWLKEPDWLRKVRDDYGQNIVRQSLQSLFTSEPNKGIVQEALNFHALPDFEISSGSFLSLLLTDFGGKVKRICEIDQYYDFKYTVNEIYEALEQLEVLKKLKLIRGVINDEGDIYHVLVDLR